MAVKWLYVIFPLFVLVNSKTHVENRLESSETRDEKNRLETLEILDEMPRWVRVSAGQKPIYDAPGKFASFETNISKTTPPNTVLPVSSLITAVAPQGICAFQIYDNPNKSPASHWFAIKQEFAGSGRAILTLTNEGAEKIKVDFGIKRMIFGTVNMNLIKFFDCLCVACLMGWAPIMRKNTST
jgi:hypothetical protein